jgi:hypothetical protein
MTTTFHGKVHGKLIELDQDPGLLDGQKVEITVRALESPAGLHPGDGFRRTEGALADDPEWDEIYRDRKRDRRSEVPE